RVSDGVVLGGAAWYYAGRQPHLAVLAFGVAMLSFLVSYERSRAESLGFSGKGGLMERAERMVVLGLGLTFGRLAAALWVLAVLPGRGRPYAAPPPAEPDPPVSPTKSVRPRPGRHCDIPGLQSRRGHRPGFAGGAVPAGGGPHRPGPRGGHAGAPGDGRPPPA